MGIWVTRNGEPVYINYNIPHFGGCAYYNVGNSICPGDDIYVELLCCCADGDIINCEGMFCGENSPY